MGFLLGPLFFGYVYSTIFDAVSSEVESSFLQVDRTNRIDKIRRNLLIWLMANYKQVSKTNESVVYNFL